MRRRFTSAVIQAEEPGRRSLPRVALLGHAYDLYDEYESVEAAAYYLARERLDGMIVVAPAYWDYDWCRFDQE